MVILVIVGFCDEEVKLFGPVQLQEVASVALPVKDKSLPSHIGFGSAKTVTAVGIVFTVTDVVFTAVAAPQVLLAIKV